MVSVIGQSVLGELKKIPGFEGSVIAGGFVRDHFLGGDFRNIDIFVPVENHKEFKLRMEGSWNYKVENSDIVPVQTPFMGSFTDFQYDYKDTGRYKHVEPNKFQGLYHCKYSNVVDVDIIGYSVPYDKDFGKNIVETFHYNIDKAWYDGEGTFSTKEFDNDRFDLTATLCYLKDISHLENAFMKFMRLKEKYPGFTWRTDLLELKQKEKEHVEKENEYNEYRAIKGKLELEQEALELDEEFQRANIGLQPARWDRLWDVRPLPPIEGEWDPVGMRFVREREPLAIDPNAAF